MTVSQQLEKLSLEEKAALLQGWSTWTTRAIKHANIPSVFMADGPHGLRRQVGSADHLGLNESIPATCFPTAATMANSWDPALGEALGRALGKEAAANDVQMVLGPGLNLKRSPLCGRNFEYFSEDPYLAGKMAAAYIRGIQSQGVAACPKHFAVNSQECRRMTTDSVVDERTLRELYLTGFEIAVKEGSAKTIMSSYNMVNGCYANENAHLLTEILRGEWGFEGFVVTDWGADNDHVEGVRAGSELVMPAPGADAALAIVEAVRDGRLSEETVDARLRTLLAVLNELAENRRDTAFDREAHHALAKKCAAESIVLLDNDGVLPLQTGAKVAIIGDFAKTPRYQGAGSSQVNPTKVDNFYDLASRELTVTGYAAGYDRADPEPCEKRIAEAVAVAQQAETVLLCVGLEEILESEGMDRNHMELSKGQQALIKAVYRVNRNVVLVLSGGAPFVMPERHSYRAALHGYLGGQAGAGAMLDVLLGRVNPSGKLSESWPERLEDTPCFNYYPGKQRSCEYREGLFVGYRYFDTAGVPVRYPFGYGLSYTSFAYSDLKISADGVQFILTNTGSRAGAEVAQLYVGLPGSGVHRPRKELKGFAKVFLQPGDSTTVAIPFDDKTFRFFHAPSGSWKNEGGDYTIMVATNVNAVQLEGRLTVAGEAFTEDVPACYRSGKVTSVSDEDFSALLGKSIPDGTWSGSLTENDAFCQYYYGKSAAARGLYKLLYRLYARADAKGKPDLNIMFVYNMPLRALAKFSSGFVTRQMVQDLVYAFNGHFWRGMGRTICDFFRGRTAGKALLKHLKQREKEGV